MVIETNFGKVEVSNLGNGEGEIYADCNLEVIPETLQKHIDEIIRVSKQKAFEKRKAKLRGKGYQTLKELEAENPIEIETPYIGFDLDMRTNELKARLNIHGYDKISQGVCLEFHHMESVIVDPGLILELLLTAVKKSAPAIQTIDPEPEDVY